MTWDESSFPNWEGTQQKRPFTISGDLLKYTAQAASGGGATEVVWQRARSMDQAIQVLRVKGLTVKALGLTIPRSVLVRTDEPIN